MSTQKKFSGKENPSANTKKGTGFLNVMKSALAAAFGVQSSANRERDFSDGKPFHFIIAGVILLLIFLLLIGFAVKIMIATFS